MTSPFEGVHAKEHTALGILNNDDSSITKTLDKPLICIGGDHVFHQWFGKDGTNGLLGLYQKFGVKKPYVALNTDEPSMAPGASSQMMTWDQLRAMNASGLEVTSHSARHINSWKLINTGVVITYTGANASGTCAITSTGITLTDVAVGAQTVLFSTYTTLSAITAAINALTGWTCSYALCAELDGAESSKNFLTIPAQTCTKNVGKRFALSGGISLHYTGTAYNDVDITVTSTYLQIWADGVRLTSYTFGSNNLNTLVSALNALTGLSGIATLCDNSGSDNYLSGLEDCTNLRAVSRQKCISMPLRVEAGISYQEVARKSILRPKVVAAGQGISITGFMQSGGHCYPEQFAGNTDFSEIRGNALYRSYYPFRQNRFGRSHDFLIHNPLNYTKYNAAKLVALVKAIANSDAGSYVFLIHDILTDASPTDGSVAGSSGFFLSKDSTTPDMSEADFVAFLTELKAQIDTGNIRTCSFSEINRLSKYQPLPRNYVFNPKFINSGEALYNTSDTFGLAISGWLSAFLNTTVTSVSINANGELIYNPTANFTPLSCEVQLQAGRTYEIGYSVKIDGFAGTGMGVRLDRKGQGDWNGSYPGITYRQSEFINSDGIVRLYVTIPNNVNSTPAIVRSIPAGPFNLSTSKHIKVQVDGLGWTEEIDCTVTAVAKGRSTSAVLARDIVEDINNALKAATANYPSPYWQCAFDSGGKVCLKAPADHYAVSTLTVTDGTTTTGATAVIFGTNTVAATSNHAALPSSSVFPHKMSVVSSVTAGTVTVSAPFCREVDTLSL